MYPGGAVARTGARVGDVMKAGEADRKDINGGDRGCVRGIPLSDRGLDDKGGDGRDGAGSSAL